MKARAKSMRRSPWAPYVGKSVSVRWRDVPGAGDWPYFYIIGCAGDNATVRGIDYPDGSTKHGGSECEIEWREVADVNILPPPKFDDSYKELIEGGVLDKAKSLVDGRDKQQHYGPPEEFMGRLAKMWGGYLGIELKPTDAALMMAILKAARLRTNPEHEDSLIDFAGYARIFERVK